MSKTKKESKKGKYELVIDIVGSMPDSSRDEVVSVIQEQLDTNRKNASTYYGRYLKEIQA